MAIRKDDNPQELNERRGSDISRQEDLSSGTSRSAGEEDEEIETVSGDVEEGDEDYDDEELEEDDFDVDEEDEDKDEKDV